MSWIDGQSALGLDVVTTQVSQIGLASIITAISSCLSPIIVVTFVVK